MTSAKQRAANLRNAQKSTGPKTQAGKARIRFNALKHGLCTNLDVIPGESPAQFAAEMQAWQDACMPQDVIRMRLAEKAGRCSWRLGRVYRAENAHLTLLADAAVKKFDKKHNRQVNQARKLLTIDLPGCEDKFRVSYGTMDVLASEWRQLHDSSSDLNDWNTFKHHERLCRLLDNTPVVWEIHPKTIKDLSISLLNLHDRLDSQNLTNAQLAHGNAEGLKLQQAIENCWINCLALRDQHIPTIEMRELIRDAAMLSPGAQGGVMLRYEAAAERGMNAALKNLSMLAKIGDDLSGTEEEEIEEITPSEITAGPAPAELLSALDEPVPVEVIPDDTNKPIIDITIIENKPYVDEDPECTRYKTVTKMEYTAEGHMTAFAELMLNNRAAKYEREKTYDAITPQSDVIDTDSTHTDHVVEHDAQPPRE